MQPETVINALRRSDRYIESIYMEGGCYQFHLFLKTLFPHSIPMINQTKDHVASEINGKLFDITGLVENKGFKKLSNNEITLVARWSFSRHQVLSIGECQYCEEPILIDITS